MVPEPSFRSVPHTVFWRLVFVPLKRGIKKNWILFSKIVLESYILVDHWCATEGNPVSSLSGEFSFSFSFFSFFHHCPHFSSFTAWPTVVTPLACWLTHHPAALLPVIKRSVMATAVRGWKNVLRLPGTEEVRWTLSPSLKRTLKGGGEGGLC